MACPSCCCPGVDGPLFSYADVLAHLDGLGLFHMDMGLGRMESALRALGVTRLPCPVVQVAGTNGKGSTASFLQSLSMAHGFRTGLYTSPHFLSPTERIRMDCRPLPESAWPGLANRALAAEPGLTYFELLTVMTVLAFQDAEPDLLIFEAGLGGRHDATTALPADLVCFTPIGLDHQAVLGPDIAAIAADKADAMRPGMFAAVSAPQTEDARAALQRRADAVELPLYTADSGAALPPLALLPEDAELGLAGPHQRVNAQTALLAWALLCRRQGWRTDERTIRRGLSEAFIPGRLQKVASRDAYPSFLLDGARQPARHERPGSGSAHPARPGQRPGRRHFLMSGGQTPRRHGPAGARAGSGPPAAGSHHRPKPAGRCGRGPGPPARARRPARCRPENGAGYGPRSGRERRAGSGVRLLVFADGIL